MLSSNDSLFNIHRKYPVCWWSLPCIKHIVIERVEIAYWLLYHQPSGQSRLSQPCRLLAGWIPAAATGGSTLRNFKPFRNLAKTSLLLRSFKIWNPLKLTSLNHFCNSFQSFSMPELESALVKIVHYEICLFYQSILCRKLPSIDDCKYFNICKGCQIMMLW